VTRRRFQRGRAQPRGVAWFGVRSFWGHLRHFAASAIATEDIDSRDWMTCDAPETLVDRVRDVLGTPHDAPTVVEALGRDLWIDFLADTGDDVSVSGAVAKLVIAPYELPDPDQPDSLLTAPRGDILVFGGDTAYPVATAQEITNRVLVPFNRVLEEHDDGKSRVLLGIPGNHDWYDGLDGFSRMFRWRPASDDAPRPSVVGMSHQMFEYYAEWAREFVLGGKVEKPDALALHGYTPVQNASYFVLPLTPTIHVFAVDRQLKDIDRRQRAHHVEWYQRHPEVHPWVMLPDPLYRFGQPSPTGTAMVRALALDFHLRPHFLLSGDVHHYERSHHDRLLQVIAGGGGAFLHPAPMFEGRLRADVRWPTVAQSRALLTQVPFKIARGRSGFLPHLVFAALFTPAVAVGMRLYAERGMIVSTPLLITIVVAIVYALIGNARRNFRRVAPLAVSAGALTAAVPVLTSFLVTHALVHFGVEPKAWQVASATLVVAVFAGAFIFGAYLALLTRLGLEQTQAFTALDHPGFKHFVRLRVRADGAGIDGWCIGLTDPVAPDSKPVLVDSFTWRPERED
jgi:hypothetical protein